MAVDAATVSVLALVVTFLGLLLNGLKSNRESHAETEGRVRRDALIEGDVRATAQAVGRIEGSVNAINDQIKSVDKTLDRLTFRVERLEDRVDDIEERQIDDAEMYVRDHPQKRKDQQQ